MEMEKGIMQFQRQVTVYVEKYAICTLLGNMRIMPRSHIRIKPACLEVGTLGLMDELLRLVR